MTDPYSRDNEQETVTRSAAAEFAVRPLPLGHRLGELQLDDVLGVGGFGIVYRAFDRTLRRAVAIKEYMPSMLATRGGDYTVSLRSERFAQAFDAGRGAFLNEARLLAQFDHSGLVKVLHFWESHGTAYMVMPFYEGRTLKQLLDGGLQMGETQLRNIVAALLGALDTLHRAQCFHRDIALDNILIRPDGNPILLDFGAARKRIGDLVDDSAMMIKPGYAPIEQYTDDPAFSQGPWTDLYALGAVMHAMVAGELPPAAVVRSIKDTYRPLATRELAARELYSPAFLAAIDHALQLRIADRPESVAEFAAELGLREFDRPPYVAPMPPAETQPRQPAGDRDATAAPPGVEQAAQSRPRQQEGDRGAAAAGSDAAQAAQPQQHGQRDRDAAAQAGVEQTSQSQSHRQAGDRDATSAQSGIAHAQSNRQAGDRDATSSRSDAERAAQSPPHRPASDGDSAPAQPGVERTSRQPQREQASDRDVFPAQKTGAGGQSSPQKPAFSPRDGMPAPESAGPHARHGQAGAPEPDAPPVSDSPRARDAVGTAAVAGGGASSASAAAASSSAGASTANASTAATASAAPRPDARAAPLGDMRRRLRDRRTIAYAGGALAVLIAIGIGAAYLVKPARDVETATNASVPPSPAATPVPGGSAPALAQREPQPALAPPPAAAPAPASADTTVHEPAPTVATTVGGESAPQATPQSAQPAAPQIANNTGVAPSRNAQATNIAPKGSLDSTETVVANPSASGVAQPASTSVAAEAAAAAAAADQRPLDTSETIPVRFHVRPWGDIYVSGVRRGASPPLRSLSLAPGVYQIEIRNGALPPLRRTVKIDPGSKPVNIDYAFE
ncbi:protein kinase [Burkholderia oklahomensis]|uniref:serine/threonine protein kinase n=1 Tax=Burkholderia oklahomensis TaxID=342113 RepID=UPI002655CE38|nr:protein kinase [Burkholderia oklahomensis]MDN7673469.1 protein kinase [Burkholderia oklahomensis]